MKRILVAILVAAALAGCRRSEMQTESQSTINLAASVVDFDQHNPQKPQGSQSKRDTKAQSKASDFAVGQALGLFVHTTPTVGKAAECHSQNIEYATPDGGTTWNQRASLDKDLTDGTSYYATAYSPYVDGQIDPLAMPFSVEKDQTDPIKFEASDLRLTPASPLTGSGAAVSVALDFTHALAMFELKLLIPANVEGKAVDHLETVTFENLATSTSVNLATGATTTDLQSVASITPRIMSGTGEVAVMTTYRAHVPPQNVDGGVTLAKIRCKMIDGSTETMDYITPSKGWISFQAGVRTSLTLMPTAEAAFMGELPELMDGKAHTDMELPIFVEAGLRWTVDGSGSDWLTIADKVGGTYGQKLSGTSATGGWQNIYIKVSANESQTAPRTGDLTLRAWRADNSEVPAAVLRLVQNYYTFAAVGGTWNTSSAAASDPVLPFASNQQWTAESNADWLLLATSVAVGSGNPSKKFVQAGALAANKLFLQVTQNTTATARRGVVTISSPVAGAASMKLYVNQMGNQSYIEVNGLRWAVGNLVATRSSVDGVSAAGCMIGAPDDGGLYFQFGSLIGYKGGALEQAGTGITMPDAIMRYKFWNRADTWSWNNEAMVWPSAMTTTPSTWPKEATTNLWYFGLQTGWSTANQNIRDFPNFATGGLANVGVGDPCTYYLGGNWRQPTTSELASVTGKTGANNWIPWENVNGSWATVPVAGANLAGDKLFFSASGSRFHTTGLFYDVAEQGYRWSSSVLTATAGNSLYFHKSSGVIPQYTSVRSYGFPVRCVEPVPTVVNPPAASDYVEINGLRWAKGNLVATNNTSAKVGKPEDGGLYFQFGSLIGYKGGALANGGTGVGSNPYTEAGTQWWNGATAWSWGNDAAVWPDKLSNQPAAWPGLTESTNHQWFFSGQGVTSGELNATDVAKGVGDPCAYYLGDMWRLPTSAEHKALCNNASNGATWETAGGTWMTGNGGNLSNNQLFFPASGYRYTSNGSFYGGTVYGCCLSSSVANATNNYSLYFSNNPINPQNSNYRSHGFPVRCVEWVWAVDQTSFEAPQAGAMLVVNVTAAAGVAWRAVASGDGLSVSGGSGTGNGSFTIAYAATTVARTGTVTVSGSSSTATIACTQAAVPVNPPATSDYVTIGSLRWAKGNLVAVNSNECKIGAPGDYGLYFEFGSLVGWTGGTTGNGTGTGTPALDKAVWPAVMGASKPSYAWPTNYSSSAGDRPTVVDQYFFNYNTAPYSSPSENIRGFKLSFSGDAGTGNLGTGRYAVWGIGDACTYYLGAPWRLPTGEEYGIMCNNQTGIGSNYSWTAVGGSWTGGGGYFANNQIFIQSAGCRGYSNGSFGHVGSYGYCWSSSVNNSAHGLYLNFNSGTVYPQHSSDRSYGFPVRCVSSVP